MAVSAGQKRLQAAETFEKYGFAEEHD